MRGSLVLPSGQRIALSDRPVTIGRLPECTIAAQRPERQPPPRRDPPGRGAYVVVDLGSTNGTMVNGIRIAGEQRLNDGDIFSFGSTHVRFEASCDSGGLLDPSMTDQVLDILKFVLLGLLYLFFARVLWAVWSEVRSANSRATAGAAAAGRRPTPPPWPPKHRAASEARAKPPKGRRGQVARLVVVEPKARRGPGVPARRTRSPSGATRVARS